MGKISLQHYRKCKLKPETVQAVYKIYLPPGLELLALALKHRVRCTQPGQLS